MEHPKISIIIPSYNREKLILKAIESIRNQSFQDFEILVIDDASTDGTEEVIEALHDQTIRYYKLEKNSGQCVARNFGIKRAKGDFVAFLDSDDVWMPDKLEKQLACFENGSENLGGVYCYSYATDVLANKTTMKGVGYFRGDIHDQFMRGFCPPTPSLFMVKRSALKDVNGFDENLLTFVDLDLWIRISEKYEFDYIDEPLITKYEQIGDQYVNNFEKRYAGYFLFVSKWEKKIKERLGSSELLKLKQHLVDALVDPLLVHPPANLSRNIPKLIRLLISVRSTNLRYYLKAIKIFFLGTGKS